MPYQDFLIDPLLSRRLLEAQGQTPEQVASLSEAALVATQQQAGQCVCETFAYVGYRGQVCAQDEDACSGSRLPVARLVGGICLWMDPRLALGLAQGLGLNERQHGQILGALVAQFQAHALECAVGGDYGQVVCNRATGEVAIDLGAVAVEPSVRSARRPAMA